MKVYKVKNLITGLYRNKLGSYDKEGAIFQSLDEVERYMGCFWSWEDAYYQVEEYTLTLNGIVVSPSQARKVRNVQS